MLVYPPPPSTALKGQRVWQLRCPRCWRIEYYPDLFTRKDVRPIMERLATSHFCTIPGEVVDPLGPGTDPMHPGYAGR